MNWQLPDDPSMDSEVAIGTIVAWAGENRDERDRLYPSSEKSKLTVFCVGHEGASFDFGVEAEDGNQFYVRRHEVELASPSEEQKLYKVTTTVADNPQA